MFPYIVCKTAGLVLGTLYPAYASYKAVRTKDIKGYTKWMMYWILIAFFSVGEAISDVFLFWLPLYYELKLMFIIWLICPYTNGSSIMYKKVLHPRLRDKEKDIDSFLEKTKTLSLAYLYNGLSATVRVFTQLALTGRNNAMQIIQGNQTETDGMEVDVVDEVSTESGVVMEESYQHHEDNSYPTVIEESDEDDYNFSVHSHDMDSDDLEDDDYNPGELPSLRQRCESNLTDGDDFTEDFVPQFHNTRRASTEPPPPSPSPEALYEDTSARTRGTAGGDSDVVTRHSTRIRKKRSNY